MTLPKELEEEFDKYIVIGENDDDPEREETSMTMQEIRDFLTKVYSAGFQAGVHACVAALPEEKRPCWWQDSDRQCSFFGNSPDCLPCIQNHYRTTALSRLNNLLT